MASFKSIPVLCVPRTQQGDSDLNPNPVFLSHIHPHAVTKGDDVTLGAFI